jgi:hypothetical protein
MPLWRVSAFMRFGNVFGRYARNRGRDADQWGGICRSAGQQYALQCNARADVQVRRRRTPEAVKRIIIRESLKQPLVASFENLHWIDVETQELLDLARACTLRDPLR